MAASTLPLRRCMAAAGAVALLAGLGAGPVLAGEVTGNGKLITVHGRSECAFSGQEDLQFFLTDEDLERVAVVVKGEPAHAQSWGQIPKADRDFLTSLGFNPGNACNPHKSQGGAG